MGVVADDFAAANHRRHLWNKIESSGAELSGNAGLEICFVFFLKSEYLDDDNDAVQRTNQSQDQRLDADGRIAAHRLHDRLKARQMAPVVRLIVADEHKPGRHHLSEDVDDGAGGALRRHSPHREITFASDC